MATDIQFRDFEIRIARRQEQGYPVYITPGDGSEVQGYLAADLLPWIPTGDPEADGQALFYALFADIKLLIAWATALEASTQRRVRLRLDAPELHTVPWELLRDGDVMFSASDDTPFSRFLAVNQTWMAPVQDRPIRVLAVISNPTDLEENFGLTPLDVELERSLMDEALRHFPAEQVKLEFLEAPVTLERLGHKLMEEYHVLHVVAHGKFTLKSNQTVLYLQKEDGNTEPVTGKAFSALFVHQGKRLCLVVLAACQGATSSVANAFTSLGAQLIQTGVSAVVAMQDTITLASAQKLWPVFYQRLMEHGMADQALNAARSTLLNPQRPDAAVPVLLAHLEKGVPLWPVGDQIQYSQKGTTWFDAIVERMGEEWRSKLLATVESLRDEAEQGGVVQRLTGWLCTFLESGPTLDHARHNKTFLIALGALAFAISGSAAVSGGAGVLVGAALAVKWLERLPAQEEARETPPLREDFIQDTGEGQPGSIRRYAFEPELVHIPAGEFLMGSDPRIDKNAREYEQRQHRVYLPEYHIGKTPVTNAQYLAFVQATGHPVPYHWKNDRIPNGKENHPVVHVSWEDAVAYCQWLAEETGEPYRLPTEAEWEKAARWTDGRLYPWGNQEPNKSLCNFNNNKGDTTPVGMYPRGASPYGCLDMAGNVWEWTSSRWGSSWEKPDFKYPYDPRDGREDMSSDDYRVLRGGACWNDAQHVRCASRVGYRLVSYYYSDRGLRVCVAAPFSPRSGL